MSLVSEGRNILATDAKIYFKDGKPYLDYSGITYDFTGNKCKIHFPKIGLDINEFIYTDDGGYRTLGVSFVNTVIESCENAFIISPTRKNMTKAQIEKELGYPINIVDE